MLKGLPWYLLFVSIKILISCFFVMVANHIFSFKKINAKESIAYIKRKNRCYSFSNFVKETLCMSQLKTHFFLLY